MTIAPFDQPQATDFAGESPSLFDDEEYLTAEAARLQMAADYDAAKVEQQANELLKELWPEEVVEENDTEDSFPLMGFDELMNQPDPEWLVDGLIPLDCFGAIAGPPKATKSFAAIELMVCIATGRPYHGRAVKQGHVVYSVGEGLAGFKKRVRALVHHMRLTDAEMADLRKYMHLIPQPVRLLDDTHARRLIGTVRKFPQLMALFLDTWARSMLGGDENSAQEAGLAIAVCEGVRARTGCAALVIHHMNADGTKMRGSTALLGAVDVQWLVKKANPEDPNSDVEISCPAMKDAAPFKPMQFRLLPVLDSVVLELIPAGQFAASNDAFGGVPGPRPGAGFGGGRAAAVRISPVAPF